MSYGKYTSQASRTERKLYPNRQPKPRKSSKWVMSPEEIALFVKMTGLTPLEAQALQLSGLTVQQASEPVDLCEEAAQDAEMYNDLRGG